MTTLALPQLSTSTSAGPAKPLGAQTEVGNYFVANYPPFGHWTQTRVADLHAALAQEPVAGTDLGVYLHIPFCRKRCHFCYFKVYTDKNAREIRAYLDAALAELEMYAQTRLISGRKPTFIYFGGGTPSYLSPDQLRYLTDGMKRILPWDQAQEIAFEGEPGTLNETKLKTLREIGVTRLSLGIEHLDDRILEVNGRAHRSKEVFRAFETARAVGFEQINVDLIAGMLEETDALWDDTVARTLALGPDSVTIYQMEIPYNTTIYQQMKASGSLVAPVADWATKRRWVQRAFGTFEAAGYGVTAATTVTKNPATTKFLYRRGLFDGSDLLSVGVSSFGHLRGVNYQNDHHFDPYIQSMQAGQLPVYRAYGLSEGERYIREIALQLKNGSVSIEAFTKKFGVDPRVRFAEALAKLSALGALVDDPGRITFTREALMNADRLIYEFFLPEHREGRYA
jgi:oxygen-independent coproporphyrinogen-3 oxidase